MSLQSSSARLILRLDRRREWENWRRPEYRDAVTSDLIYRAVLDQGVKGVVGFERFLTGRAG
jgi:hypothetical protein